VQALVRNIMGWYTKELDARGYRDVGNNYGTGDYGTTFFLPSQPLIDVEVHVHAVPNVMPSTTVFEILVIYHVPLPKPPEEILPDDIDSITATYFSGVEPIVKTITGSQVINQIVNMVNNLPVRPDYMYFGGISGSATIFSLLFHSKARGYITVTDVIGHQETGIHIDDYPILEDVHGIFRENLGKILGVPST